MKTYSFVDVRIVNHNAGQGRPIFQSCALPGATIVKGLAPPGV